MIGCRDAWGNTAHEGFSTCLLVEVGIRALACVRHSVDDHFATLVRWASERLVRLVVVRPRPAGAMLGAVGS